MIAELGLAALWLAAALAALQLVAGALAVWRGGEESGGELAGLIRPAAIVQGALCVFSFAMLVWLFVRTDLSVKLVAMNSHSDKPLIFKIAGSWGNHEGSMLLWVLVLAIYAALVAALQRGGDRLTSAALGVQGLMAAAFFLSVTFSWDEFIIAFLLTRFEVTLPVEIWSMLRSGLSPATNAVGSLVFLVSVTLVAVLEIFVFRRAK